MKYLKGRSARQQRRREIISRLMEIAHELSILRDLGTATTENRNKLVSEHTSLCLELVELIAVDDNKIRTRK